MLTRIYGTAWESKDQLKVKPTHPPTPPTPPIHPPTHPFRNTNV